MNLRRDWTPRKGSGTYAEKLEKSVSFGAEDEAQPPVKGEKPKRRLSAPEEMSAGTS